MKKSLRVKRVEETMLKQLSMIMDGFLRDKNFPMTTLMSIDSDPGLQMAKVKISVYGSEEKKKEVLEFINKNKKHLRYLLAKKIRIKFMPDIVFIEDRSLDMIEKIERIIQSERDKEKNDSR